MKREAAAARPQAAGSMSVPLARAGAGPGTAIGGGAAPAAAAAAAAVVMVLLVALARLDAACGALAQGHADAAAAAAAHTAALTAACAYAAAATVTAPTPTAGPPQAAAWLDAAAVAGRPRTCTLTDLYERSGLPPTPTAWLPWLCERRTRPREHVLLADVRGSAPHLGRRGCTPSSMHTTRHRSVAGPTPAPTSLSCAPPPAVPPVPLRRSLLPLLREEKLEGRRWAWRCGRC
jgi:hypothetical protein